MTSSESAKGRSGVRPRYDCTFRSGAAFAVVMVALSSIPDGQARDEPDLSAISRIRQEARRSELADVARNLTDLYGPRLTGSPHLKAGADYVIARLNTWGIRKAGYERWGPFGPGWTSDRFIALALAPQSYPLVAFPKAWTPGTQGDVIAEAVLAPIETDQDFDKYRGKLRGKFVLTAPLNDPPARSEPTRRKYSDEDLAALARPATLSSTPRDEREFARKRMKFYVDEQVAALLEPSRAEGGVVLVGDGRLRDDTAFAGAGLYPWPDEVAAQLVLAAEHYNRIARTVQSGSAVTLEANITNAYHPAEPDSFNIVAEIPGTDLGSQVVMLGAHFDSWHAGTGATDNAAGCAVMLEAMRILKATGLEMRRTVRLTLWNGSEQGLLGSRAYVRQHFADVSTKEVKPAHAELSAYFNLDGGTGAIRGLYLEGNQAVAPIFAAWMTPFKADGATTLSPRSAGVSDHLSFDEVGLPGFQFIQDPSDYETRTRHTNIDVFEQLQLDDLARNAVIVASLVYHTANRGDLLPRKSERREPKAGHYVIAVRLKPEQLTFASYCVAPALAATLPFGLNPARPDGRPSVNQNVPSLSRSSFGVCAASSGNGT